MYGCDLSKRYLWGKCGLLLIMKLQCMSNAFEGCLARFVFVEKMFFLSRNNPNSLRSFVYVREWNGDPWMDKTWGVYIFWDSGLLWWLYYTRCFIILYQSVCMFQGIILAWMILFQRATNQVSFHIRSCCVIWFMMLIGKCSNMCIQPTNSINIL